MLRLIGDTRRRHVALDAITFHIAISLCAGAGAWAQASLLLL